MKRRVFLGFLLGIMLPCLAQVDGIAIDWAAEAANADTFIEPVPSTPAPADVGAQVDGLSPVRLVTVAPDFQDRWFAAYYLDDTRSEPQLLFEPLLQAHPDSVACSPDGNRLASNSTGIDVTNLETGAVILLDWLLERDTYGDLDWSAVDNRLAYAQWSTGENYGISVLDLDTLEVTPLIGPGSNPVSTPRWSPDGTRIVYTERQGGYGPLSSTALWVMNVDGTDRRQLTAYLPGRHDYSPDWSPRGGEIVFSRNGYLTLISDDGAHEHTSPSPFAGERNSWSPLFSPDGQQIAFVTNEGEKNAIYVMDRDGSNLRRIHDLDRFGDLECWLSAEPPNLDKVRG